MTINKFKLSLPQLVPTLYRTKTSELEFGALIIRSARTRHGSECLHVMLIKNGIIHVAGSGTGVNMTPDLDCCCDKNAGS